MSGSQHLLVIILLMLPWQLYSQDKSDLTIEKIMQDPKWAGTSPSNVRWSEDGSTIYFNWNPENFRSDSLYKITLQDTTPIKVDATDRNNLPAQFGSFNKERSLKVYAMNGDLFMLDINSGHIRQLTNSINRESNPRFIGQDHLISFQYENNLYQWDLKEDQIKQLTNFKKGKAPKDKKQSLPKNEKWLLEDQLAHFDVLQKRKKDKEDRERHQDQNIPKRPEPIYYGNKFISNITLSPDLSTVSYRLTTSATNNKSTKVPNYVSDHGFTEDISARSKVGSNQSSYDFGIYNLEKDSSYILEIGNIPGIYDIPKFIADSGISKDDDAKMRKVIIHGPEWSENGEQAVVVARSLDNKDRWIMSLDVATGKMTLLDRQHDDAWIGGPGISSWNFSMGAIGWMPDNETLWYQSEESGYSQICLVNVNTGKKKTLTKGKYEIYNPFISRDKKYFYYSSNELHPGERHFYRMPINGGKPAKLTDMAGRNDVTLSPDEKTMVIRHSYANKPWDLYTRQIDGNDKVKRITNSSSEAFKAYNWREPEFITFKASDGATVHARLYSPGKKIANGPAVVFVHGAGYLQNAHKWWSSYFREYMFHNFLADHGYTVLDIDYRGSAGYGRDWRTGIYRFMGGKDLTDQVDGAKYLVDNRNIDPDRIGIYGGSYGGFITLMAMFTKPGTFKAGAALRSVTDWAHYNHPYTANILNTPVNDSIAYARSSPIYYAEGFEGALLICHGMIDTNVHFQDVVRLAQRLIELGKDNWEFAVYPLENHGFVEPSSWTDEYKRIFKLFEEELKGG